MMEDILTPRSPLQRIGVNTEPNNKDKKRNALDERSNQIRRQLMESNTGMMDQQREQQQQELIASFATAVDPARDFTSLDEAGRFLDDLQGRRDRVNNYNPGADYSVGSRPYSLAENGFVDLSSLPPDIAWILDQESEGNPSAKNKDSSAFGIGQLILANREHYGEQLGYDPWTTNVHEQWDMMMAYIRDRYGSVEEARRFWEANGWY